MKSWLNGASGNAQAKLGASLEKMRQNSNELDPVDYQILWQLQADSRLSMRKLGALVGLSAPAVTERVRRMEEAEVITGYGVKLSQAKLGRHLVAFIAVKDSGRNDAILINWAKQNEGVLECHSVTGVNSCILKVAVSDISALDEILRALIEMGFSCDTSVVLKTSLEGKKLQATPSSAEASESSEAW